MGLLDPVGTAADDAVGSVLNTVFDLQKENIGGFFSNLTLLNMLLLSLNKTNKPFPKTEDTFEKFYDYVIIGAGPGGSVLANRLSELPCVSVLLMEAGGDASLLSEVPSLIRLLYGTEIDWLYYTTPQKYGAFAQNDNRVPWNSGKALGGGSVLNAMLYVRGNMENYNDWERAGAKGWAYNDVLYYFLKLEDNRNMKGLDRGYHRKGGPMTAEKPNYIPEIKNPILEATKDLNFETLDVNGRRQLGIYDLEGTLRNQQRCSTAKAYLVPAEDRPNLTIIKEAFATKILIREGKAEGVEFFFKGEYQQVYARKEVIVSSGSVRAPQLLMLSGIGPKEHLEKHKIQVLVDSPGVGKNLQDHAAGYLNFKMKPTILNVVLKNLDPLNILDYITNRKGPMAAPNQVTVMAFLNGLNNSSPNSPDFPRQELYWAEYATVDVLKNYNIKPEVYEQVYLKYVGQPLFTCIISLLQPYSRGEILLNSVDPFEQPIIEPNYYEDPRDLDDIIKGMEICKKVGTSKQLKEAVGAEQLDTIFPGCEYAIGNQTEEFACQAKQLITTFWHPVGTCKMGSENDKLAVVDPTLRVYGVQNLRVVCAAVMPIIPSGNTNVPTMMVSEKIADEMKKELHRSSATGDYCQ